MSIVYKILKKRQKFQRDRRSPRAREAQGETITSRKVADLIPIWRVEHPVEHPWVGIGGPRWVWTQLWGVYGWQEETNRRSSDNL